MILDLGVCTSQAPCSITDYGDPNLARPEVTLTTTEDIHGLEVAPGDVNTVWRGLHLENLHLTHEPHGGHGFGIFLFRDVGEIEMSCLEIEGFGAGIYAGDVAGHISLTHSHLHDNSGQGWLGGGTHTRLEWNRFHNNGWLGANAFSHNLYLSEAGSGSVVRGNWLTASSVDAQGSCQGASLNLHGGEDTDLIVEGNLVEELNPSPGCWGIAVDSSTSTTESHTRAIIRGNVVRNVGNISIGIASCIDCVIENNLVVQSLVSGVGISVPNRPSSPPDADNTGTIVRHNTVAFGGVASNSIAYYVGERGVGYQVSNNIAYFDPQLTNSTCFSFDLNASAYDLVSNNLCANGALEQGTLGLHTNALEADPQFVSFPTDLRLSAGSPAVSSGDPSASTSLDIRGASRGATPNRGAYEGAP